MITLKEDYFFKANRDSNAIWFLNNKDVKSMYCENNKENYTLSVEYKEI